MDFLNVYVAGSFLIASVWALEGTNTQAAAARERLRNDEDDRVAEAADLWRPSRWLARPATRRRRAAAEAELRVDPDLWDRYQDLCSDLKAWNYLESSVALAMSAALLSLIRAF
ncbi:MAG TPA: hypothetical protein VHA79_09265 [Mycobacteriales bacterium]|nr:hypothetical protein [Mycobacteriales bacterium]